LPQEVKIKLVNIPLEVLVKTIETLDLKSREIQIAPAPVLEDKENAIDLNFVSDFCLKQGGKIEIKTNVIGYDKFIVCHFPDGTECGQKALLNKECPAKPIYEEPLPGQVNEEPWSPQTTEDCHPVCKHVGTQSEGWYDSCTGELMKDSKCGAPPTSTIPIPDSNSDSSVPPVSEEDIPSTNLDSNNIACPSWAPPAPDWCKDGREVSGGIGQNGCKLPPKCIRTLEQLPSTTEPACIQVITYAISGGLCKAFPTPCDVPSAWQKVDKCPEKAPETGTRTMEEIKQLEGMRAPESSLGNPSLFEKVKGLFQ